jgi:hypothetical protein
MNPKTYFFAAVALFFNFGFPGAVHAVDHASKAKEHAAEAADAKDSRSIREHTAQALKHLEAAKAAHAADPETLKHLKEAEKELHKADAHAGWHNTDAAARHADDGKSHLDAAGNK